MAVGTEHDQIVRMNVPPIAVDVLDLEGNFAAVRIALVPAASLASLAVNARV
jgi:hypothetical protein